jgi:hypothetical protein
LPDQQTTTLETGKPCGTPDAFGQYSINVASYFTSQGGDQDHLDLAAAIRDALFLPSEAISKKVRLTTELPFP